MMYFPMYPDAKLYAEKTAKATGIDIGIESCNSGWSAFFLPKPKNRCGHELQCEVVTNYERDQECDDCQKYFDTLLPIEDPWGGIHGHICEDCNEARQGVE